MSESMYSLLHPGVQEAVFRRGWKELHPIQSKSIGHLLQGDGHLLICAQTAGGKTEAAFLPIISKIAENPRPSVQALYVGPLVALINDQFSRLETLCEDVDVPVHRWHGSATSTEKQRFRDAPGGILLITPESLESNFINFGRHLSRLYADLEFVVIDELHSFLSDVRGIHLRSLLARLFSTIGRTPRIVGLSATLGDPQGARSFLSRTDPESVTVLESKAAQTIAFGIKACLRGKLLDNEKFWRWQVPQVTEAFATLTPAQARTANPLASIPGDTHQYIMPNDELDDIAMDIVHTFSSHTNLVFGNAKQGLEILADRLHARVRELGLAKDPFHVHHGSLSKEVRLETEAALKSGQPTTVLCSSTLEMGIDIGAVRRVGQLDPPWSVASMRQRLGRSGRREGEPSRMCIYSRDDSPDSGSSLTDLLFPNLLRSVALARLMLAKWVEPHAGERLHLSTFVHQVLSCLRQTGGMNPAALHATLVKNGAFPNLPDEIVKEVLWTMGREEFIEQMPQKELILAPKGEAITADRDFYAVFMASEEFIIRNGDREIGKLQSTLIPPIGENLILGGRRWQVDDIDHRARTVFVSVSQSGKPPYFRGGAGEVHDRVMKEMQAVLSDSDEPSYVDASGLALLRASRKLAEAAGVLATGIVFRRESLQWFPWVGTRGLRTLQLYAASDGFVVETDPLSITYKGMDETTWRSHLKSITHSNRTPLELARHMKVKSFDKFDSVLPDELLDQENAIRSLDLPSAKLAATSESA